MSLASAPEQSRLPVLLHGVVDDVGAVTGVLVKRGNGSTVLYNAKNVIVATGGRLSEGAERAFFGIR